MSATGRAGSGTISVVVVDDHPMFREAIVRAVDARDDMAVVGEAGTGRDGIETVLREHPKVCVLDLNLPDISGARVLDSIAGSSPGTRVLVLSGNCDSDVVYAMLEAGAAGFELKTAGGVELSDAIAAVARGETVLPAELHGGLAEQIRARRDAGAAEFSEREIGILQQVADGRSASEIASSLNLAESTVKTHLTRIYDKLGVSERAAAVAEAIRRGVIE